MQETATPRSAIATSGWDWVRIAEVVALLLAAVTPVATYLYIDHTDVDHQLLSPPAAALSLLANLLPFVALIVLAGRRVALRRTAGSALAGGARLHVRLVAMFTLMASVPIVLTVIAASVMFQSGVQLWGGERARSAFSSTIQLGRDGQRVVLKRWTGEARYMAAEIASRFPGIPTNSRALEREVLNQTYYRSLYQSVLFRVVGRNQVEALYGYERPPQAVFAARVSGQVLTLRDGEVYSNYDSQMLWVVTPIDRARGLFLYVATPNNVDFLQRQDVAATRLIAEYDALRARARSLQLQFNAVLFGVALLIIGLATWIALAVADRLVRPVGELVAAARAVEAGDLSARVPEEKRRREDEVGILANAFNQMTGRLQAQTGALESRRALLEAVLGGVSAGVISVDGERAIRVINRSAVRLLAAADEGLLGTLLVELAPELDALIDSGTRETIAEVAVQGEPRTLAVKVARIDGGAILTFDDITQAQLDQRRAAWSDVARRIAHEIKNPLTPIQLAAERLQRRYGKTVAEGDATFGRLTETIVRQVGDLRRMVDEFSSFARMPKPVFREESLVDVVRQSVFLHEVAHTAIAFTIANDDPGPQVVCDRRQLGQAITNIVKNAVEAIEARPGDAAPGRIDVKVSAEGSRATIGVVDNGVGLPAERERIVEPYVTTRARGTGLGLAIVSKIVEEHFGTITFGDRLGGGTAVTIVLDTAALARLDHGEAGANDATGENRPAALTRSGTT